MWKAAITVVIEVLSAIIIIALVLKEWKEKSNCA
jgi:hypothetical protein